MKKKLLVALGVIVALGVVGVVVLSMSLGTIVKAGVNQFGPAITKTKVELQSASVSPFGSADLKGLYIGNPEGWHSDKLASLGHIEVSLSPLSMLSDNMKIKKVVIEAPEFVYETKLISSNVKDLMNNIEETTGGGEKTPETKSGGAQKKITIEYFLLKDAKVTIGVGSAAVTVPMPDLELRDLGTKEGGLTPGQMVFAVSKQITANIITAAGNALKTLGSTTGAATANSVGNAAKSVGNGIKSLFGGGDKKDKETTAEPKP